MNPALQTILAAASSMSSLPPRVPYEDSILSAINCQTGVPTNMQYQHPGDPVKHRRPLHTPDEQLRKIATIVTEAEDPRDAERKITQYLISTGRGQCLAG